MPRGANQTRYGGDVNATTIKKSAIKSKANIFFWLPATTDIALQQKTVDE